MFDVEIVEMAERCPLIHQAILCLHNRGIPRKDDILNVMSCLIHLGLLLCLFRYITFLDFVFSFHLNHLSSLADKVKACCHLLS